MMEGVDYSYSRPDPVTLKRLGKHFAVRYVGTPWSSKNLSLPETRQLQAAGIDLVAVYETTAGYMLVDDGRRAALVAYEDALQVGMPEDRPIYFALDINPNNLSSSQWARVEGFLSAASAAIGPDKVGIYGGYMAVQRLVSKGFARYGWQTYAWSAGAWSAHAHLHQYRNGVTLAGGTVDFCRSIARDFGQWATDADEPAPIPQPTPTPKEILMDQAINFFVRNIANGAVLFVMRDLSSATVPCSSMGVTGPWLAPQGAIVWNVQPDDFDFFVRYRVDNRPLPVTPATEP